LALGAVSRLVTIHITATLLERDRELTELGLALDDAEERHGRVVLIEAPSGLGKTSLLAAGASRADDAGFTCLRARASDLERDFAYGLVRQLLEPVVAAAGEPERDGLFAGAASLSEGLFSPGEAGALPPPGDNAFSVLHGLYWLVNNLATDGPVALLVDDLHWSDAESLGFLSYLGARLDGLPVVVIATTRPGEGDIQAIARLASAPETKVVRPRPLSVEATAELSRLRLGPDVSAEFVAACRDATGGNPFFLEALLREAIEQGFSTEDADQVRGIAPAAVARSVLLRLSGKPPAARALVDAAAVLGDGASLAEAAALAGVPIDDAGEAADLLATLGLFQSGEGVEFAHSIVQTAVRDEMGARAGAIAHARAVEVLTDLGASAERVAAQIVAAEPAGDARRVELLRKVAAEALIRGAPAAAVAWLRRALAEPPPEEHRIDVLAELGGAEVRLGSPRAVEHLRAVVEAVEDPDRLTIAISKLALALTLAGDSDAAYDELEPVVDRLEREDLEHALVLEAQLASHAQQASPDKRRRVAERLERRARLEGRTRGERLVLASLAYLRAKTSGSAAEAATHLERPLEGGKLLRELQLDVAGPFYDIVVGLLSTDALDVADAHLEDALVEARGRGSIPGVAFLTDLRGWVSLRRGRLGRAECDARTSLELLTSHGITLGVPYAVALLVRALTEQGDLDAADRELRTHGLDQGMETGPLYKVLSEVRGLLRLAQGRTREGLDELLRLAEPGDDWGSNLAARWRSNAALGFLTLGDRDEANRLAAEDLELARDWGAPSGVGAALRVSALVEEGEEQVPRLREAVAVLETSPARLELARALTDLGAALRRGNRRVEARGELERGLRIAKELGARPLADRARTDLRAAGGRSIEPNGDGVSRLTTSELRVAELAAKGHSNPEIAQALFVTRKTVETHLGHVYAKLAISGRGQLGGVLDAFGSSGS
jgi:ATP/maltotriose-dependent transcriptional regulator MalT